jgi:hypothetical protein
MGTGAHSNLITLGLGSCSSCRKIRVLSLGFVSNANCDIRVGGDGYYLRR